MMLELLKIVTAPLTPGSPAPVSGCWDVVNTASPISDSSSCVENYTASALTHLNLFRWRLFTKKQRTVVLVDALQEEKGVSDSSVEV
jgi:hypothetical protein